MTRSIQPRNPLWRAPLILAAMLSLLTAIWGGLIRLPVHVPLPGPGTSWVVFHGPIMISGFLGSLIGVERAVALKRWWAYTAPVLSASGSLLLIGGMTGPAGPLLLLTASAVFAGIGLEIIRRQRALFTLVMALGALAWFVGNLLWLRGWPVPRVIPWWTAFLLLTIVGERLELTRFQRPSRLAKPLFIFALALFLVGLIWSVFHQIGGERLLGIAMVALAFWLFQFDIGRRTIRLPGLPRFTAVCLLSGYGWLAVSGAWLAFAAPLVFGFHYDAVLHAFFLGFVFSMIFGHAPIIFPAVLHVPIPFRTRFYLHLGLLHLSLLVRLSGDLAGWLEGRQWGGILNGLAILFFLANTATAALAAPPSPTRRPEGT